MPKVLVLFDDADHVAAMCGESAAEGARGVRFTEVDVRVTAAGAGESRRKMLESASAVDDYDAIVIVGGSNAMTPAIKNVLGALSQPPRQRFANMVFGAGQSDGGELAGLLAELGGIVVAQGAGADGVAARDLGARVAKLAGWVRHSLSHEEAEGGHAHHHSHHHAH